MATREDTDLEPDEDRRRRSAAVENREIIPLPAGNFTPTGGIWPGKPLAHICRLTRLTFPGVKREMGMSRCRVSAHSRCFGGDSRGQISTARMSLRQQLDRNFLQ